MGPGTGRAPLWRSPHVTLQPRSGLLALHGGQGSLAQTDDPGLDSGHSGFGCIDTSCSVLRGVPDKC